MFTLLIAAVLAGPLPDAAPTLSLRVHLGKDARSRIARHELENPHHFWVSRRMEIGRHYRLIVDEDSFDQPTYQIGHGPREPFAPGACAASGSFIRSLTSICELDNWERLNTEGYYTFDGRRYEHYHRPQKPETFPPLR